MRRYATHATTLGVVGGEQTGSLACHAPLAAVCASPSGRKVRQATAPRPGRPRALAAMLAGGAIAMFCLSCDCSSRTQIPVAHAPESYRLWCAQSQGYYPDIQNCPGGWEHRSPDSPASAASTPLLVIPVQPPAGRQ